MQEQCPFPQDRLESSFSRLEEMYPTWPHQVKEVQNLMTPVMLLLNGGEGLWRAVVEISSNALKEEMLYTADTAHRCLT